MKVRVSTDNSSLRALLGMYGFLISGALLTALDSTQNCAILLAEISGGVGMLTAAYFAFERRPSEKSSFIGHVQFNCLERGGTIDLSSRNASALIGLTVQLVGFVVFLYSAQVWVAVLTLIFALVMYIAGSMAKFGEVDI